MKTFWITWHYSQRSRNLAKDLRVPILEYVNETSIFNRHFFSSIWTWYILIKYRPSKIYLQYSYLLLLIIATYKFLNPKSVQIICDCHTKALRRKLEGYLGRFFWSFKKLSFSFVDICIISNTGLEPDIKKLTNEYVIMQDKIPQLEFSIKLPIDKFYCVFICSFAVDEPLSEVVQAAEKLNGEIKVLCTGKIPKTLSYLKSQPYPNIFFTDYLKDDEYINLIAKAQCIIALTTEEDCLQCAGYEALSVSVPLIVSNKSALKTYFADSAVYVENEKEAIIEAVRYSIKNRTNLQSRMEIIKKKRMFEYKEKMLELKKTLRA